MESGTRPAAWDAAVARASEAARRGPVVAGEECWDFVAVRDIIALVLYALHLRQATPVEQIDWMEVLRYLDDDHAVTAVVDEALARTDAATTDGAEGRPGLRWRWLTRTWDVRPLATRWDGLIRGIGRGLPDPAVEVCTPWAASSVTACLEAARGGLAPYTRIRVMAGPYVGQHGYIRNSLWGEPEPAGTTAGPAGYLVSLDDHAEDVELPAAAVRRAADCQWPARPIGSLHAHPVAAGGVFDHDVPSCADHVRGLLASASNDAVIPAAVVEQIATADRHVSTEYDCGAQPRPYRLTWHIIQHSYHRRLDSAIDLYEVDLTRHLHDPSPRVHLAMSATEAHSLIAAHAAALQRPVQATTDAGEPGETTSHGSPRV